MPADLPAHHVAVDDAICDEQGLLRIHARIGGSTVTRYVIANLEKARTKTGIRYTKLEPFCPDEHEPPDEPPEGTRARIERLKQAPQG